MKSFACNYKNHHGSKRKMRRAMSALIASSRFNHLPSACKASTSMTLEKETYWTIDGQRPVANTFAMHPNQLLKITARHNQSDHRQYSMTKAQKVSQEKSPKLMKHLCQLTMVLNSRSILRTSHAKAHKR